MLVSYGSYDVEGKNLVEIANKLSNHLGLGDVAKNEQDIGRLVLKAVVRIKAETEARKKRAEKEGKQVKETKRITL
ncbi:MAG: hypothetical protein DRJ64_03650 [Thermoprotei archaeon]|nr:MAG: hypothetical protein DRJ64_03650 [Thermoprotei archaeon]